MTAPFDSLVSVKLEHVCPFKHCMDRYTTQGYLSIAQISRPLVSTPWWYVGVTAFET